MASRTVAIFAVVLYSVNGQILQWINKEYKTDATVSHLVSLYVMHIGGVLFLPWLLWKSWKEQRAGRVDRAKYYTGYALDASHDLESGLPPGDYAAFRTDPSAEENSPAAKFAALRRGNPRR